MKFASKDMKTVTVILKRIVSDKKKGLITLKSNGDGILHIFADNKFIGFYTTIASLDEDAYSFTINLYELDKMLTENDKKKKEKLTEMDFKRNIKSIKELGTNTSFKVEPVEWDESIYAELKDEAKALPEKAEYVKEHYLGIPPSPWGFVHDEVLFLQVLKEGFDIIKKTDDIRTMYIALRPGKALATEDRRTHIYRLEEDFPFESIYLHRDVLQVLSSSIKKGEIKHKKTDAGLFIQYGEFLFQVHDDQQTVFPNIRKTVAKQKDFEFDVNAKLINEGMKQYKADVTDFICQIHDEELHIIPNLDTYEHLIVPIENLKGKPLETKFSSDVLKGFFGSFSNKVHVEHIEYRNVKRKDGYLWRVYTPEQMNVCAGVSRLDFEFLDRMHKEGKLQKISTLQELEELKKEMEELSEV